MIRRQKTSTIAQGRTEGLGNGVGTDASVPLLTQILQELREIQAMLAGTRKDYYTVDEVAELTGRTPYTVRRWLAEKRITATRVSGTGPRGRLLIARDQLDRLIGTGLGGDIPNTVTE